jgi:type IV pilus assembly protein PilQ
MAIKRLFTFLTVFLICGIPIIDSQSANKPSQVVSTERSEITGIDVYDVDGTTEIEIRSTTPFTYTIYKQADPYHVIVDLQGTDFGMFREKMEIDKAGVLEILPVSDDTKPDITRFEIALMVPADIEPVYKDNALILAFDNPEVGQEETVETETQEQQVQRMTEEENIPEVVEEEPIIEQKYVGEKISIDFQDAELTHVFRLIADISGYNMIVSPDVKGKFSMRLIDVPWDQALDVILRNYSLSKTLEGNIIRIAPTSVLAVKKAIDDAKILTKRGFISVDERTSSVIIKDVEHRHAEYESLIDALDMPTPQVSIDAKIVEVRSDSTKDLGIQWGMLWEPPDTRLGIGGDSTLSGGVDGFRSGQPLMVNLPAIVGSGKGGHVGIGGPAVICA